MVEAWYSMILKAGNAGYRYANQLALNNEGTIHLWYGGDDRDAIRY